MYKNVATPEDVFNYRRSGISETVPPVRIYDLIQHISYVVAHHIRKPQRCNSKSNSTQNFINQKRLRVIPYAQQEKTNSSNCHRQYKFQQIYHPIRNNVTSIR